MWKPDTMLQPIQLLTFLDLAWLQPVWVTYRVCQCGVLWCYYGQGEARKRQKTLFAILQPLLVGTVRGGLHKGPECMNEMVLILANSNSSLSGTTIANATGTSLHGLEGWSDKFAMLYLYSFT